MEKKFRIQIHSVSPMIRSGYGRLCNEIGKRLAQKYTIIASCYYGLEPGGVLNYNGILCIPAKSGPFGENSCVFVSQFYKTDIQFLMSDGWAFPWFPRKMSNPYFYGPMDSYDYGQEIINIFKPYRGLIAVSKFQQKEWSKYGLKVDYIPHGVDISIFKPFPKEQVRKTTNLPQDKFIIGTVGANADKESRKSWDRMAKAIRIFLEANPDARNNILWAIHTNPIDSRGVPIERFIVKQGIRDITVLPNPMITETMLTDNQLAFLYNSFDVLLHTSMREGFGLCILEAMSCGTPVIATDTTSMTELVKGHGWLAKPILYDLNMITTPINAETTLVDVYDVATKLEEAYFKPNLRRKYAQASRKFAIQYNWDDIINTKWIPLLEDFRLNELPKLKQKDPKEMIGLTATKDRLMKDKFREIVKHEKNPS